VRAPVLAILFATGVWAQADLILSNGKIITVDERFSIAQAIAIRGTLIAAVGTDQEIAKLAGPNTRRIDLKGKAVIPGLIDNHMHLLRAAATWTKELRFDGVESRKQAIEMLRAKVKAAWELGGSSVHSTGSSPGFISEALPPVLTSNQRRADGRRCDRAATRLGKSTWRAGDGEPGDDCGRHFGSRNGCRTTDHRQWHTNGIRADPLSRHVVLHRRPRSPHGTSNRRFCMCRSTAHRAVNAVPYVCAAAPGIHTTLDLPQVVPILS